jgi:hypothetical protein
MMNKVIIKLATLNVLSLSLPVMATGFVNIPATGFSDSAYTLCNTTGNFGSAITINPTASANNTCAVFPNSALSYPGYGIPVASTTRQAIVGGVTVGTVTDRVFRNSANTSCLFVTSFTANNNDWDTTTAGTQYFSVNDIARGGFGSGSVNAGYYGGGSASPVYRIGRTFTSVQHRALAYDTAANKLLDGINYLDLPTANSVNTAFTGEPFPINSLTTASTSLATQDAVVNSNWIDFTLDVNYQDDDGNSNVVSSTTYIEAACDGTAVSGWIKPGAIRLRQTGQENTTMQEIIIDGYAPPGATLP